MIKLQKISLAAGLILLAYAVAVRVIEIDYSFTSVLIINYLMTYLVRGVAAIFAGIVANKIDRAEIFFIIFAIISPAIALTVLAFVKPKKKECPPLQG